MYSNFTDHTLTNNLESLLDTAWHYINQQNINKAISACQLLTEKHPENDDAWFAYSFLYFQLGKGISALSAIKKARSIKPNNKQWLIHQAHCLILLNEKHQAKQLLTNFVQHTQYTEQKTPLSADLTAELALVLNKLAMYESAEFFYQQAINLCVAKLEQESEAKQYLASLYFNLASMQRYLGKLTAAITSLDNTLSLNPSDCEAFLLRASLAKQSINNNHIKQGQQLLQAVAARKIKLSAIAQAQLHYGLAKEFEDIQDYPQSFKHLQQGANIRRKNMRYQVEQDTHTIEKIIECFDKDFFQKTFSAIQKKQQATCADKRPIFILGLPRTGSTLVERILSSHSNVTSAGELNDFAITMMAQLKKQTAQRQTSSSQKLTPSLATNRAELIALSTQLDFGKLGKAYSEATKIYSHKNEHFIDKLPLNSLYIGLIHLALPHAKIIQVKRNPMDTCYAIYKQLFTQGYPFSYDLNELAQYVIAHHKLMNHWHSVLPNVIHSISYDHLIQQPVEQSKLLINFCQLEWQDACEHFHQNNAASITASASQIRQPIYKSSLKKWRNYEQQLAPLQQQLKQAGLL